MNISNYFSANGLRRFKVYALSVLVLLICAYGVGRPIQIWLDGFYHGARGPYLQMPSPTAITLRWQTSEADRGVVLYGTQPGHLDMQARDSELHEEHEIRLEHLEPATKYYYSIVDQKGALYAGPEYWFYTPKKADRSASVGFVVLGDPGYPGDNQKAVRTALTHWLQSVPPNTSSPPIDLLLTTGDNAYRSGSNEQYQQGFFAPYQSILRNVPVWPVYGNHDARRHVFYNVFSLPAHAESGGLASGSERYYSFDNNLVHFVVLDTVDVELSDNSQMLQWLQQDLSLNRKPWIVALFHHPPYTKGSHDSDNYYDSGGRMHRIRKHVLPILEQGGVDLVISGHSHTYERSHLLRQHYATSDKLQASSIHYPSMHGDLPVYKKLAVDSDRQGAIYVVLGASAKLSNRVTHHPVMAASKNEFGFLSVRVHDSMLEAQYVSASGQILDQFAIRKSLAGV